MFLRIAKIFLSVFVFMLISSTAVFAWSWLIASDGDPLTFTKWNELVAYVDTKLESNNIIAGSNISLSLSGSDITINGNWGASAITSNRDDADIFTTRYYGTSYDDNSWKIDRETWSWTGTVRTVADAWNNASQANYWVAWTNRITLTYD